MNIAVYTLCRDRLEYTQRSFASLEANAGMPYDHYVIDNGSEDGTASWLENVYKRSPGWPQVTLLGKNVGISRGSNLALDNMRRNGIAYDYIVKMDNDCLVVSKNTLSQMVEIMGDAASKSFGPQYALSPRVEGINNQPNRYSDIMLGQRRVGLTGIIGGLFHMVPGKAYQRYRYPTDLPLAKYQDDRFCDWFRGSGGLVGYVEGLIVEHMDGTDAQAQKYPEYFKRKWVEEASA